MYTLNYSVTKHNTWDAMIDSKTRLLRLTDETQPKLLENVVLLQCPWEA